MLCNKNEETPISLDQEIDISWIALYGAVIYMYMLALAKQMSSENHKYFPCFYIETATHCIRNPPKNNHLLELELNISTLHWWVLVFNNHGTSHIWFIPWITGRNSGLQCIYFYTCNYARNFSMYIYIL